MSLGSDLGVGGSVALLFLGVDGGSSRTEAAIVDAYGQVLGRGVAGPSNLYTVDEAMIRESVTKAIMRATWQAGIEEVRFAAAFFGMAGAGTAHDRYCLTQILSQCVHCGCLEVHHDAYVALAGATECSYGLVLLAGTGSCAFGVNPDGKEALVGGWGHRFGDEGSAYDVTRRALQCIARAADGRGMPTTLTSRFAKHLGVDDSRDTVRAIYRLHRGHVPSLAALAPLVTTAASEGDAVARQILAAAAHDLVDLVLTVVSRLKLTPPWTLVPVGGLFTAGEIVLAPLRDELARRTCGYALAMPKYDGTIGAAMLAARLRDLTLRPTILPPSTRSFTLADASRGG